jgi:hypothetical protein
MEMVANIRHQPLYPREKKSRTHRTGGSVGPRASLDFGDEDNSEPLVSTRQETGWAYSRREHLENKNLRIFFPVVQLTFWSLC